MSNSEGPRASYVNPSEESSQGKYCLLTCSQQGPQHEQVNTATKPLSLGDGL